MHVWSQLEGRVEREKAPWGHGLRFDVCFSQQTLRIIKCSQFTCTGPMTPYTPPPAFWELAGITGANGGSWN